MEHVPTVAGPWAAPPPATPAAAQAAPMLRYDARQQLRYGACAPVTAHAPRRLRYATIRAPIPLPAAERQLNCLEAANPLSHVSQQPTGASH
jgi:hypothetical protein